MKELANRITQLVAATLSDSQDVVTLTSANEDTVLRTPGLTAELESAVAMGSTIPNIDWQCGS